MAKKPNPYHDYPKADETRTGMKVGWRIYIKREDAEACAKAAKHNAKVQESLGYDFGYQSPGWITKLPDGRYEVVIP